MTGQLLSLHSLCRRALPTHSFCHKRLSVSPGTFEAFRVKRVQRGLDKIDLDKVWTPRRIKDRPCLSLCDLSLCDMLSPLSSPLDHPVNPLTALLPTKMRLFSGSSTFLAPVAALLFLPGHTTAQQGDPMNNINDLVSNSRLWFFSSPMVLGYFVSWETANL